MELKVQTRDYSNLLKVSCCPTVVILAVRVLPLHIIPDSRGSPDSVINSEKKIETERKNEGWYDFMETAQ